MNQELIKKLCEPFLFEEVEAKIQVHSKEEQMGMAVFYIDSRAIQKRLDEVVGAMNWSNQYITWQDKSQICGISIFNDERKEWVTKHDGAENSDIEAIKGGLTDAFKRAAVLWGIGRYLYQIDGVWVETKKRGNSTIIKETQTAKLKAAYEAAVKRMFGAVLSSQSANNSSTQQKSSPSQTEDISETPQTIPLQDNNDAMQSTVQNDTPDNAAPMYEYKIHSMKPSGESSQLLELCNNHGELTKAYIRNGKNGIAVGAQLKNVRLEKKSNAFGNYNLIADYEVAAA